MMPSQNPPLCSEEELALYCARVCPVSDIIARIRVLSQGEIVWPRLLEIGRRHGLVPLLYQNLNTICPEAVPEDVLSFLRSQSLFSTGLGLHFTSELLRLLELLADQDIAAVPFKGPTMAVSAYNNLALRPFGDLDFLVREQDFVQAKDLFIAQGYRVLRQLSWECHFINDRSGIELDLHQAVASQEIPFPLRFERLWKRLEPVSLDGVPVNAPSLEDLLVILCVHLVKDCWNVHAGIPNHKHVKLIKVADIAELLRSHSQLDWDKLMHYARTLRSERMLLFGLLIAHTLVDAKLPKEILHAARRNPLRRSFTGRESDWVFRGAGIPLSEDEHIRFQLLVRERLRDRVGLMLKPTVEDENLLQLPSALRPLYYLLRPIRLIGKYGLKVGKL